MAKVMGSLLVLGLGLAAFASNTLTMMRTSVVPVPSAAVTSNMQRVSTEMLVTQVDPANPVPEKLITTPDRERVAFVVKANSVYGVAMDGITTWGYDNVSDLQFSPDGQHLAFIARVGKKMFVVVDRRTEQSYDTIVPGSLVFSPNGRQVAYVVQIGKGQAVVLSGEPGAAYDRIAVDSLIFGPDSNWVAYVATLEQKQFVVADGEEGKRYDAIFGLKPVPTDSSSDSSLVLRYAALLGNQVLTVEEKIK